MVCEHRCISLNGFAPCGTVVCKGCNRPRTAFDTAHDDGQGLTFEPPHYAYGGWSCSLCVVRVNLRLAPGRPSLNITGLLDLETQRQIDVQNARALSTRSSYLSHTRALREFGHLIGVDLLPTHNARHPQPDLAIPTAWYTLDRMSHGGQHGHGRALSTLDGHHAAYTDYFVNVLGQIPPTRSQQHRDFMKGLARRVQYRANQAHAMTVAQLLGVQRAVLRTMQHDPYALVPGHALFDLYYNRAMGLTIMLVSFLATLRGSEPFQLTTAQVIADRQLSHTTPHYWLDFAVTKTSASRKVRVPVVAVNSAGLNLGRFMELTLHMRARLPASFGPYLFVRPNGARFTSSFFLHEHLRPAFKDLQKDPLHQASLAGIDVHLAITTNSLRRGGNTAAANAGVPRYLRMGHSRWRPGSAASQDMADLYDEVSTEDKLAVSYAMRDPVPLATRGQSPTTRPRRLDFNGEASRLY